MQTLEDLQAAVQQASDNLATALVAGADTAEIRKELDEASAALSAHQNALQALEQQQLNAEAQSFAAEVAVAESVAVDAAVRDVETAVAKVPLPDGVTPPPPVGLDAVARAAAEVARLQAQIDKGAPQRQQASDEVARLRSRLDAKRAAAAAIRERRAAGHEEATDAAQLSMLQADADDLGALLEAAQARQRASHGPVQALRQQMVAAEQQLHIAKMDAVLHQMGDRLRAVEQCLIAGARALRGSLQGSGHVGDMPAFWSPSEELRKISYGMAV